MSDVKVTGKPTVKKKKSKEQEGMKLTENQEQIDLETKAFTKELEKQRSELKEEKGSSVEATKGKSPLSQNLTVVEKPKTLTLTVDDIAKIVGAANGTKPPTPHLVHQLPEDASLLDRAHLMVDDALGEVGKGAHRVADGARDILGGVIDILTLGRSHRK